MEALVANVNWVAIIVGAVASFMLGWLWYSPKLFGTQWAAGVGINIMDNSGPKAVSMITQAVGTFLLAWAIGVTEVTQNIHLAILVGLMVASLIAANGLFAQKSAYAIWTETGFVVAMTIVMIIAQGLL